MQQVRIQLHRRKADQFESLGLFWAQLSPCAASYPFKRNGQERYEGQAYRVVIRYDFRVLQTEKITWGETEFFLLDTPQESTPSHLTFRIFSWKTSADMVEERQ